MLSPFYGQCLTLDIGVYRVAELGRLLGNAKESLRAFVERVFANVCVKNIGFLLRENKQDDFH